MSVDAPCSVFQIRDIPLHTKRHKEENVNLSLALSHQRIPSLSLLMSSWNPTNVQRKFSLAVYFTELKEQRTEEKA